MYQKTIAANIVGSMNPIQFNYCLRQAFFCFFLQIFACVLYFWDFRGFDSFYPIETNTTFSRVLTLLLLHKSTHSKFSHALKMFTFLKRAKGKNTKTKYMNIILISCQILVPIVCNLTMMLIQG